MNENKTNIHGDLRNEHDQQVALEFQQSFNGGETSNADEESLKKAKKETGKVSPKGQIRINLNYSASIEERRKIQQKKRKVQINWEAIQNSQRTQPKEPPAIRQGQINWEVIQNSQIAHTKESPAIPQPRLLQFWEIFRFILPTKVRRKTYEPAYNGLVQIGNDGFRASAFGREENLDVGGGGVQGHA